MRTVIGIGLEMDGKAIVVWTPAPPPTVHAHNEAPADLPDPTGTDAHSCQTYSALLANRLDMLQNIATCLPPLSVWNAT